MHRRVRLCLSLWLLFACEAQAQEVTVPGYRLATAAPPTTTVRENVSSPWGKAHVVESLFIGGDAYYIFRAFSFSSDQPPAVVALKQVRASFLKGRKCATKDVASPPVWSDARDEPWPQTVFAGQCEISEKFMLLTAIADERVYQLQVVQGRESDIQSLSKGMTWLIRQVKSAE